MLCNMLTFTKSLLSNQRDRSVLEQKMTEFENTAAEIEMLLRDSGK